MNEFRRAVPGFNPRPKRPGSGVFAFVVVDVLRDEFLPCLYVEFYPLGDAPDGELVRVKVNSDHDVSTCLEMLSKALGGGQPLSIGAGQFVAVFKDFEKMRVRFFGVPGDRDA